MYGFVITTHHNNYDLIYKCLSCLFKHIPTDSYVILYINESTCYNINTINKQFKKLNIIKIKNQIKNNGLTGTWNQGIYKCIENKCDVITILGHDTYKNKSIKYLLFAAERAQKYNKLEYYGPLFKNYSNKSHELFQDEKHWKNYTQRYLIGSIFTFPLNTLIKNKLNKNYFFDEINYPFGYNDIEWYERFKKINGKAVIIEECIIEHMYQRSWIAIDKNTIYPNQEEEEDQEEETSEEETSEEETSEEERTERKEKEEEKEEEKEKEKEEEKEENKIYPNQEEEKEKEKEKQINFNWINYLKNNPDLLNLNLTNNTNAYNHYMTIGKYQNRKY